MPERRISPKVMVAHPGERGIPRESGRTARRARPEGHEPGLDWRYHPRPPRGNTRCCRAPGDGLSEWLSGIPSASAPVSRMIPAQMMARKMRSIGANDRLQDLFPLP